MRGLKTHHRLGVFVTAMLALSALLSSFSSQVLAADGTSFDKLALDAPITADVGTKVGSSLLGANGSTQVVVQLKNAPLSLVTGDKTAAAAAIKAEQDAVASAAAKYGATELARLDTALNAVILQVDAGQVQAMAAELNAKSINKVGTYQVEDASVNAYIGATAVQNSGLKGQGLKVAVLDSGVDFTHANLGGPGTVAFYQTCYAQRTVAPSGDCANYFGPSAAKVYGGYDFVGETWPNTPEQPDPNPIDFEGHGTHVADIIAGKEGVAPEARILAVKVCSSVSSSCSGLALLQGVDYATKAKVDVMNLSLGSNYGQQEDDLTDALNNSFKAGIIVVAAAGNNGDKTYTVSSPSIGFGVISVAQTTVPSDRLYPITVPASIGGKLNNVILLSWSPPFTASISAPLQWGVGADKTVCNPVPAGSFAGKIALIDRGACAASIKAANASAAGAVAVLIANNVPKAGPYPFAYGGGNVTAPSFSVSYEDGLKLRTVVGQVISIDKAGISNAGTIIDTSARGPFLSNNFIKPDIGAPGASISADVGTGTGTSAFGGTSGATPVIAGSALLLKQKHPDFNPSQIKSLLMNTADTNNRTIGGDGNYYPTPITRIGGGEVRVNKAVSGGLLAYAVETGYGNTTYGTGSLSYGYQAINNNTKILTKKVRVTNLTNQGRLYKFKPTFRDPADKANGAVTFQGPTQFWLNGGQTQDITVQMQITGPKLRPWNLEAGLNGNEGATINELEYDGYIVLDGGPDNTASLAWQVFPHKVADTSVRGIYNSYFNKPIKVLQLANDLGGSTVGQVDVFSLIGTNGQQSGPAPAPGSNQVRIDLKAAGVRDVGSVLQFAVNTYGERATPVLPAEFDFYVDTNGDGVADYVVFNREQGYYTGAGFGNDGRVLVAVQKLTGTSASAYFYADATYNSANLIMSVPKAALGVVDGQAIGVQVKATDLYFTGAVTDSLPGAGGPTPSGFTKYTVGSPRYTLKALPWTNAGSFIDSLTLAVPTNGTQVELDDNGANLGTAGLLLMYRDGALGREAEAVTP